MPNPPVTPTAKNGRKRLLTNDGDVKEEEEEPLFLRKPAAKTSNVRSVPPVKRARRSKEQGQEDDSSGGIGVLLDSHDNLTIDITAIILDLGRMRYVGQKNAPCRTITICDIMSRKTSMTLWWAHAKTFFYKEGDLLRFENVKVRTYNGMPQADSTSNTRVEQVENNSPLYERWRGWWDKNRHGTCFKQAFRDGSVENVSLKEAHEIANGEYQGTVYFFVNAKLRIAGNMVSYDACPDCNKKVMEARGTAMGAGRYYCDTCRKDVKKCDRYLFRVEAREGPVVMKMTAFDDVGRALFGKSAEDLQRHDPDNPSSYQDALDSIEMFVYNIRCSAKKALYNDKWRAEFQICDVVGKEEIPEKEREKYGHGSSDETMLDDVEEEEEEEEEDDVDVDGIDGESD